MTRPKIGSDQLGICGVMEVEEKRSVCLWVGGGLLVSVYLSVGHWGNQGPGTRAPPPPLLCQEFVLDLFGSVFTNTVIKSILIHVPPPPPEMPPFLPKKFKKINFFFKISNTDFRHHG